MASVQEIANEALENIRGRNLLPGIAIAEAVRKAGATGKLEHALRSEVARNLRNRRSHKVTKGVQVEKPEQMELF